MAPARKKGDGRGRLGGRVKGTPNKVTAEAKKILTDIVNENAEEVRNKFRLIVDPKEYITLYLKMCEYVLPKKAAVSISEEAKVSDLRSELSELAKAEDD